MRRITIRSIPISSTLTNFSLKNSSAAGIDGVKGHYVVQSAVSVRCVTRQAIAKGQTPDCHQGHPDQARDQPAEEDQRGA
jgi:hypothetical protein